MKTEKPNPFDGYASWTPPAELMELDLSPREVLAELIHESSPDPTVRSAATAAFVLSLWQLGGNRLTPESPSRRNEIESEALAEAEKEGGFYEGVFRWYLADPSKRPLVPFTQAGIDQFIDNELKTQFFDTDLISVNTGTRESLENAIRLDPNNVGTLLRMAELLNSSPSNDDPELRQRAAYYAKRAVRSDTGN